MKRRYNPILEISVWVSSCAFYCTLTFYLLHYFFPGEITFTITFVAIIFFGIFFNLLINGIYEFRIKLFGSIYPGRVDEEKSKKIMKRLKQIRAILLIFFSLAFFTIDWIINGILQAVAEIILFIFVVSMSVLTTKSASFTAIKAFSNAIDTARELEKGKKVVS